MTYTIPGTAITISPNNGDYPDPEYVRVTLANGVEYFDHPSRITGEWVPLTNEELDDYYNGYNPGGCAHWKEVLDFGQYSS